MKNFLFLFLFVSPFIAVSQDNQRIDSILQSPEKITRLYLENDYYSKESNQRIIEHLHEFKNLRKIHLERYGNELNYSELFTQLSQLPHLDSLILSLSRDIRIPDEISLLQQLTYLDLSDEQTVISPQIGTLKNLKHLSINSIELQEIPKEISQLQQLETLFIRQYLLRNELCVPAEIGLLTHLKKLKIHKVELEDPETIQHLTSLTDLTIYRCRLHEIPSAWESLHQLETLDVSANNLREIPDFIYQNQLLQTLELGGNQLHNIDENICQLQKLQELNITGNIEIKSLPDCINQLQQLKYLDIRNTKITILPSGLENLPLLTKISICDYLIKDDKELSERFGNRLSKRKDCRLLENEFENLEEKYGTHTTAFKIQQDTIILKHSYFYNEPGVIDEEYWIVSLIKLRKNQLVEGDSISLDTTNTNSKLTSIWSGITYTNLFGTLHILKKEKKQIKAKIVLWGRYDDSAGKLIDATFIFEKKKFKKEWGW